MKYNSLIFYMKEKLDKLYELRDEAENEEDFGAVDGYNEQIESIKWQIELVDEQMFSDYSNY